MYVSAFVYAFVLVCMCVWVGFAPDGSRWGIEEVEWVYWRG